MSERRDRRRGLGIAASVLYALVFVLLVFPVSVSTDVAPFGPNGQIGDSVGCGAPVVAWATSETVECRAAALRRVAHSGVVMLFELPVVVLYLAAAAAAPRADG